MLSLSLCLRTLAQEQSLKLLMHYHAHGSLTLQTCLCSSKRDKHCPPIGRLSSNPNGNVLLSHRYPCKCDSAVCAQPFRYYH